MNEQQDIEFKKRWSDTILKTACAFANTNGGIIYIGIDDNGNPVELKKPHASCLRNPLLADIFYKAGYIESWGRGTLNIIDYCTSTNLPEPEMSEEMNGFLLVIYKYGGGSEKSSEKSSEKILQLISENPYTTISELAKFLNLSTRAIEKQIKKLQENNKLKRIGPAKGGHWEVVE